MYFVIALYSEGNMSVLNNCKPFASWAACGAFIKEIGIEDGPKYLTVQAVEFVKLVSNPAHIQLSMDATDDQWRNTEEIPF